jgi:hypothetical protein
LVTRVAALFEEEEALPCCFGEIFFSAIRFTPSRSRPLRAVPGEGSLPRSVGTSLCHPSRDPW